MGKQYCFLNAMQVTKMCETILKVIEIQKVQRVVGKISIGSFLWSSWVSTFLFLLVPTLYGNNIFQFKWETHLPFILYLKLQCSVSSVNLLHGSKSPKWWLIKAAQFSFSVIDFLKVFFVWILLSLVLMF